MKNVFIWQLIALLINVSSMASQVAPMSEEHVDKMSIEYLVAQAPRQDSVMTVTREEASELNEEHGSLMRVDEQNCLKQNTVSALSTVVSEDDSSAYKQKLRSFVKSEKDIKQTRDNNTHQESIKRKYKKEKLSSNCAGSAKKHYSCHTCKAKFSFSSNLARHKREQHKAAAHKCTYCDSSFKRKESYLGHLNTHDENPYRKFYRCTQCDKEFFGNRQLRAHRQAKH